MRRLAAPPEPLATSRAGAGGPLLEARPLHRRYGLREYLRQEVRPLLRQPGEGLGGLDLGDPPVRAGNEVEAAPAETRQAGVVRDHEVLRRVLHRQPRREPRHAELHQRGHLVLVRRLEERDHLAVALQLDVEGTDVHEAEHAPHRGRLQVLDDHLLLLLLPHAAQPHGLEHGRPGREHGAVRADLLLLHVHHHVREQGRVEQSAELRPQARIGGPAVGLQHLESDQQSLVDRDYGSCCGNIAEARCAPDCEQLPPRVQKLVALAAADRAVRADDEVQVMHRQELRNDV
mmetsp:Transcript_53091/g.158223  ORF Transcript_53091/g.158223 Transcript_53091/m.158223 type:complete len:289 (+) Transcript_53091:44-910(+)